MKVDLVMADWQARGYAVWKRMLRAIDEVGNFTPGTAVAGD